jgi:NAD-dependent deacetylase
MDEQELQQKKLQEIIDSSAHIVFFGGAGVSTESGIPDFRSTNGVYNSTWQYPPEEILSHDFFMTHTQDFYRFYREKMIHPLVKPNQAHFKLAELEQAGKLNAIVTQNIDGLHQAAGSKTVWELHGSIHRNYCMTCGTFYPLERIIETDGIPYCTCKKCGGIIKPDVVLYQEGLDHTIIDGATAAISAADTLIIGGTSLAVYPAASLIHHFSGHTLIIINKGTTPGDGRADLVIREKIGIVLGRICVKGISKNSH